MTTLDIFKQAIARAPVAPGVVIDGEA